MKKFTPLTFLTIASLLFSAASAEEIDMEARRASTKILETRIEERDAQLTESANDLLRLHERLSEKLDRAVKRLSSIKDSAKSRSRVSSAKLELIEGLRAAVKKFQNERRNVFQALPKINSDTGKRIQAGEVDHFDEHIEKHLGQILQLSKSFTQDEDVKKYERDSGGSYYDGYWGWESSRISDEYRQNRRDRVMNKKQRTKVLAALTGSKQRCHALITDLQQNLKNKTLSDVDRELMSDELARHTTMLKTRQRQLNDLQIVNKPETTAISRDAAVELKGSLKDLMDDIRGDLQMIFVKHSWLRKENAKIYRLRKNLEARKEWLKKHDKGASK